MQMMIRFTPSAQTQPVWSWCCGAVRLIFRLFNIQRSQITAWFHSVTQITSPCLHQLQLAGTSHQQNHSNHCTNICPDIMPANTRPYEKFGQFCSENNFYTSLHWNQANPCHGKFKIKGSQSLFNIPSNNIWSELPGSRVWNLSTDMAWPVYTANIIPYHICQNIFV